MSGHLSRLMDGGMITVQQHGRYRYYQLAGPHIAELVEVVARVSPTLTITSLKAGTRAHAVRRARRCYDHMGGRLAVAITAAFIRDEYLAGHDGSIDPDRMPGPRPAGGVLDPIAYTLTETGATFLAKRLGVHARPHIAVRCCVDWIEHQHHLAGSPRPRCPRHLRAPRLDQGGQAAPCAAAYSDRTGRPPGRPPDHPVNPMMAGSRLIY